MTPILSSHRSSPTHGTLTIYAAPKAVLPHIEWALNSIILPFEKSAITYNWRSQPCSSGTFQLSLHWNGNESTASHIASALKGWHYIIFEILEISSYESSLYMHTPELGIFRGAIGAHGEIMVNESQISRVIEKNIGELQLREEIDRLIGRPWDRVLERYRRGNYESYEDGAARLTV